MHSQHCTTSASVIPSLLWFFYLLVYLFIIFWETSWLGLIKPTFPSWGQMTIGNWEILLMVLVLPLQSGSLEELFHRWSLNKGRMLPVCTAVTYGIRGLFYSLHTHTHIHKTIKIKQHLSLESQKELSWWGGERRTPQNGIIKLEGAHLSHVLHCPHQPRQ